MSKTCPSCGLRSPAGMRFCGGCGRPLSETSEVRTSPSTEVAQRRHITVMFCDLVGSTPLAETLDAEDLRDVILRYQLGSLAELCDWFPAESALPELRAARELLARSCAS